LRTVSAPRKGEHANQTFFVTEDDAPDNLRVVRGDRTGNVGAALGFALFTDGIEGSLVDRREGKVAPALRGMFGWLRGNPESEVSDALRCNLEDVFRPRSQSGDDCTLVLVVEHVLSEPAGVPAEALVADPPGLSGRAEEAATMVGTQCGDGSLGGSSGGGMARHHVFKYETRQEPLLPRGVFIRRLATHVAAAALLIAGWLTVGMVGCRYLEGAAWIDSFLDAAMTFCGRGPTSPPLTWGGKLFTGLYALSSWPVLVAAAAIVLAPLFHRRLHHFHAEAGHGGG
jgi:hypothetical protein